MAKTERRAAATITPCSACPLRRNAGFRPFEKEELAFVAGFKIGETRFGPGDIVLRDGETSPHLYTVLRGWTVRYKVLADGKRQVLNFALPGDIVGLQSSLMQHMTHTVEALTDLTLCTFERKRVWELYQGYPGLAFDLTWLASREESMLAAHLANIGQRPAFARMAYMLVHLFDRARRAGLVEGLSLTLPITQEHLADALGLSMVHTNKTLQRLRATGWLQWKRQDFVMCDEARLRSVAEYDPIDRPPRPFI